VQTRRKADNTDDSSRSASTIWATATCDITFPYLVAG
jgi:hypothetical protein